MDGKRSETAGRGVDLIVSRNAGRLQREPRLAAALGAAARAEGAHVHETRTHEELDDAAQAIARRGTDGVLLAGGDGSIASGLTALDRAFARAPLPAVALVPAGTVCTIARNYGIHGAPVAWTRRAARALREGTAFVRTAATLRVRDDRGGERVGMIFAGGLVVRFFELYDATSRPGLATAARIAIGLFAGALVDSAAARRVLEPTPGVITVDGHVQTARAWSLVVASTVPEVAPLLRVAYRAGGDQRSGEGGVFHVVASGLRPRALGAQLLRVLRRKPLVGEPRVDTLAEHFTLAMEETGAYVLDGDRFAAREVHVASGPPVPIVSPRG